MTFDQYVKLTKQSVAERGYNYFYPCACIVSNDTDEICVLDGALSDDGEEVVAKEWVATMLDSKNIGGGSVYLAFRAGNRTVVVCDIKDRAVVDKVWLQVEPYKE